MASNCGPQSRQHQAEGNQLFELGAVAEFAPARVIQVLLAFPIVFAGDLQMSVRMPANPYVGPRGRNYQRFQSCNNGRVGHSPTGRIDEDEPATTAAA